MRCDDLEPLIEAIADGSHELSAEDAAHVKSCAICAPRFERARLIESLLSIREVAQPPASFTLAVMARVSQERWKAERAIDLGAIWEAIGTEAAGRVLSQVQTIGMSAVLLTMALVLWWWAEAASE